MQVISTYPWKVDVYDADVAKQNTPGHMAEYSANAYVIPGNSLHNALRLQSSGSPIEIQLSSKGDGYQTIQTGVGGVPGQNRFYITLRQLIGPLDSRSLRVIRTILWSHSKLRIQTSEQIMHYATITRKKAQRIPAAVLVVIVILICMSFVPPASALVKSVPITITANFNPAKPAAIFSGDPTEGLAPLTVQFTDLTPVKPNSYLWDFGDGTTSTDPNPLPHTYKDSGLYTVSLSVTFAPGGVLTKTEITNYIAAWASSYNLIFNTPGLTGTTDITFDPVNFTQHGGTWSLDGNILTLNYPPGSSFKQLVITFDPAPQVLPNGIITGHVYSATLETKDLAGSLISGVEQHTIIFYLSEVPAAGSGVQTDTIHSADPQSLAEFERLALENGLTFAGAYYEMFVSTTIPDSIITGMGIKMAIPSGLYNPDITIIGIDPQGNGTILPTTPVNSGGFIIFNFDDPQSSLYDTFGMALLQTPRAPSYDSGGSGGSDPPGSALAA